MIRWIPYTFIRITFFFTVGILTGIFLPGIVSQSDALTGLVLLIVAYFILFVLRSKGKSDVNPGVIGLVAVFIAGYINVAYHQATHSSDHFIHKSGIRQYEIVITGYPEEKGKSWKVVGEMVNADTGQWTSVQGNVLLYLDKDGYKHAFTYGDRLLVKGQPQLVPAPGNPHEFNYQQFLAYRNIYHQHFLRKDAARFIGNDPPSLAMYYSMRMRAWSASTLKLFATDEKTQGIANALVLGVTDGLDHELLSAYSSTGSMHVLAVSGLHISIIYWIILMILKPVHNRPYGKWLVSVIALFILWSYAFITGLSPSVLRAVTMFTFLEIGRATSKDTNIFNTLAASAFCLLLFDPYLIMSVGFQLSYLAVLGIVYIHPLLVKKVEPNSWLLNEVWKITSVSIAAQLATFPLGLFYFHQFPNYFLLSNLLVIPVSFGVLILGLVVLATAFVAPVAALFGYLLGLCIKLMNIIVYAVDWLPYSLTDGISITPYQCALLSFAVIAAIVTLERRHFRTFVAAMTCMMLFVLIDLVQIIKSDDQKQLIVYRIPGHSAMDMIANRQSFFVADSALIRKEDKIGFHVKPNRIASGTTDITLATCGAIQGGKLMYWQGKQILYISDKQFVPVDRSVDYVIIANNAVTDIDGLTSKIRAQYFIFDSSNSFYQVENVLKKNISGANIHSVLHDGAFQIFLREES